MTGGQFGQWAKRIKNTEKLSQWNSSCIKFKRMCYTIDCHITCVRKALCERLKVNLLSGHLSDYNNNETENEKNVFLQCVQCIKKGKTTDWFMNTNIINKNAIRLPLLSTIFISFYLPFFISTRAIWHSWKYAPAYTHIYARKKAGLKANEFVRY